MTALVNGTASAQPAPPAAKSQPVLPAARPQPALPAARPVKRYYRSAALGGFLVIAIAFGGLGTWAATAPLNGAAVAMGTVKVESSRKEVQHLEGGIVKEILVRDGDYVRAGDPLIRMDSTNVLAQRDIVRGQLDAARALEARLVAERNGEAAITFPDDLQARRAEENVASILKGQTLLFDSRREARDGQIRILRQRVAQYTQEIQGLEAQGTSKRDQIRLIERELEGQTSLYEKGYAALPRVLALQREKARLQGEYGEHIAAVARTRQAIGEVELQVLQIANTFREEVANELRRTQTEIFGLSERLVATEDVLRRLEVTAPRDGYVMGLNVHTVGGVIGAGQKLMQIVPDNDRLVIEAQLSPVDIDDVRPGQTAFVRFSTLNTKTTPVIEGKVLHVSADRITDERTGAPYYAATVELHGVDDGRVADQALVAGMPADVMIQTTERTALHYIMSPLTDMIAKSFREH